jgi:microsomal dipeptidase-like Zn-dependent dipeptidase
VTTVIAYPEKPQLCHNSIEFLYDDKVIDLRISLLVAAHINHIRAIAGVNHVGLGAGYDGINL